MGSRSFPFRQDVVDDVIERVANGECIADICAEDNMPSVSTWFKWRREHTAVAQAYVYARESRAEVKAARIERIARTPMIGEKTTYKADGTVETVEADMIEHRRLMIETDKWLMARLDPKGFGDRQQVEHSGSVSASSSDDPDEIMAEILEILASGRVKLPAGYEIIEEEDDEDDFSDIA